MKLFSRIKWSALREYLMIALGLVMYATAWKAFLLPHQITGGGATGVSAIVQYGTGIPVAITYAIINGVLLIFSLWKLGLQFSLRTIYGVACLTLFFAIIPDAKIGTFVSENEPFMACVLGGILAGSGMGIMFLNNGSSGGTDIIAKIINKYRNITLGRALLYCDVLIISSSYFLPTGNIEKVVYGLTTMAIATFTLDMVVNGVRQSVQFLIFSAKYEDIANAINNEVHRGVTILDGTGWYSKQPVKVITVLARKNESAKIFKIVKDLDPNAFVSQSSAIGVYGQGFDPMKIK
ncbi:MAG: YitT family protein [Paludibacteraceae bacterium]